MIGLIVGIVVVAVAIALRRWRRARSSTSSPQAPRASRAPRHSLNLHGAGLVAAREITERVKGRPFRVGTAFILLAIAAAIAIPVIRSGPEHPQRVGIVGALPLHSRDAVHATAAALGIDVAVTEVPSLQAATAALHDGHLDVAIVHGAALVVNGAISADDTSPHAQLVSALASVLGTQRAYDAAGLSGDQIARLSRARPLSVESLTKGSGGGAQGTSIIGVILVFIMLSQYNTWILLGVMEEKAGRVVEVLLSTLRPTQLLGGKVAGIGLVALGQASVVVAFALGLAAALGSNLLHGTGPIEIVSALVWLVLGYAFYCWVYAAAASMAERQDQVQSLAFPLSIPILVGYVSALTVASTGQVSLWVRVLSYLPPTAPFAMPVLVGVGKVQPWQFALSAAITIASTVVVARFAAVIYRRAILRTGGKLRWRDVVRATS